MEALILMFIRFIFQIFLFQLLFDDTRRTMLGDLGEASG